MLGRSTGLQSQNPDYTSMGDRPAKRAWNNYGWISTRPAIYVGSGKLHGLRESLEGGTGELHLCTSHQENPDLQGLHNIDTVALLVLPLSPIDTQ